jgi:hypothetical protein
MSDEHRPFAKALPPSSRIALRRGGEMTYARFTQRQKWWVQAYDDHIRSHSPSKRRRNAPTLIPLMLPDGLRFQGHDVPANPYEDSAS